MDFSREAWAKFINSKGMPASRWLKDNLNCTSKRDYWSDEIVLLPRKEQEILYARMMIEVPEEGET